MLRVGIGYDVHQLVEGRKLILGGVELPHSKGLLGHSDADVLCHAIMDALLGSLALGDIGQHFPDTDLAYKGADSMLLLQTVYNLLQEKGYQIGNLDAVIMAEQPKMKPHLLSMRENIAEVLECSLDQISLKATTTEKLGFVGREEGIAVEAIVMVHPI